MELITRSPATVGDVLNFLDRADCFVPTEKMASAIFPGFLVGTKSIAEWKARREELIFKASRKLQAIANAYLIGSASRMINGQSTTCWSWISAQVESPSMRELIVAELTEPEDSRLQAATKKVEAGT